MPDQAKENISEYNSGFKKEEPNNSLRCTCQDEYVTHPCPVHFKTEIQEEEHFGKNAAVITDLHIVPDRYRIWEGFVFSCPHCKEDAIMHFANCCSNCGKPIKLRSKVVTAFIKNLPKPK